MSNKLDPKIWDLLDPESIVLKVGEDSLFMLNFGIGVDVSGYTFDGKYSEYKWPYSPASYDLLLGGELTDFDLSQAADGIIYLSVDADTVLLWRDRRISLRIYADNGTRKWVASDRVVMTSNGD